MRSVIWYEYVEMRSVTWYLFYIIMMLQTCNNKVIPNQCSTFPTSSLHKTNIVGRFFVKDLRNTLNICGIRLEVGIKLGRGYLMHWQNGKIYLWVLYLNLFHIRRGKKNLVGLCRFRFWIIESWTIICSVLCFNLVFLYLCYLIYFDSVLNNKQCNFIVHTLWRL